MINPESIDIKRISSYIPSYLDCLYDTNVFNTITKTTLRDAFHYNQVLSKAWLLEEFLRYEIKKDASILVIGSWIGFTTFSLVKNGYTNIKEIDMDPVMAYLSGKVNYKLNNFHYLGDVNLLSNINTFDIIINTSCEHIADNSWFGRIKNDAMIFLQSNNFNCPDHVNICKDLTEMITKYPMTLIYQDTLVLNVLNRFMLIGSK